jgi:hypothetical protein
VKPHERIAAQWLYRSARLGNSSAIITLGGIYTNGTIRAYAWFDLAWVYLTEF